jgi:glyoxylase-like metal-dependent hydrolase (beta-lactamase superfamily II)
MLLHQRFIPGLAINSYLVGDERTGEAAVIDATRDVDDALDFANANGLQIRYILETHVHADFVSGSRELKARLKNEPIIACSGYGGRDWTQPYPDQFLKEEQASQSLPAFNDTCKSTELAYGPETDATTSGRNDLFDFRAGYRSRNGTDVNAQGDRASLWT